MIDDLKPYPAYKDSGVQWLGEVPQHWELPRLGAVLRECGETNDDGHINEVLSVLRDRGVIPYAEKGNVGNKKSGDITRYKIVRPDDVVVNCMNVIIGSVGLSKYTGCLSPVYYVLTRRSEIDDPRYINAYFQTEPFQLSLVRIGNGILAHRMRIPMELLKCEPFPRPPADEQSAIVRFLDHADRRVRRYIKAKQKLIKLLEEQKQTIIQRAVTRGLDPNVRLKPSGIEWLGEVPEHWKVGVAKRVSEVFIPQRDKPGLNESEGFPWITLENIGPAYVKRPKLFVKQQDANALGSKLVPEGSIVASCIGRFGVASITTEPVIINQQIQAYIPKVKLSRPFFRHCVRIAKPYFDIQGNSTTLAYINREAFGNMPLCLPPLAEQQDIVKFIDEATKDLSVTIERADREISLLREYRTRLIADVVTGKLDVREAAAKLPDEIDVPESRDDAEALMASDEETEAADFDAVPEEGEV